MAWCLEEKSGHRTKTDPNRLNVCIFVPRNLMQMSTSMTTERLPYKVKDIGLADWGRKEIRLAEAEMPGSLDHQPL